MKEIERFQEKEITCPYCGWEMMDSWEALDRDEDSDVFECDDCGKKFNATKSVEVRYNSNGLCKENKVEHNWKEFDHVTAGKRHIGRRCLTCGEYEFGEKIEEVMGK